MLLSTLARTGRGVLTSTRPHRDVACAHAQGRHRAMYDALLEASRTDVEAIWTLAAELDLDRAAFERCLVDPAIDAAIDRDIAEGTALGVTGTPAFFVGGERLVGAQPMESFEKAIARALAAREPTEPSAAEREQRRDELRARLEQRRAEREAQRLP